MLRSLALAAALLTTALSSAFAAPPAAPSSTPQRALLRWKLPQGAPLGYELVWHPVDPKSNSMRVDASELLKGMPVSRERRQAIFDLKMPGQSVMALVLASKDSGDLTARLVPTRVDTSKMPRKTKLERDLVKQLEGMVGTVQVRANLTERGFVTNDLKREPRNLVAVACELPSQAVAVGDTWTHSANLLEMGTSWEGKSENVNRVQLVSLEREAEGRTVALIDFTLAERKDGHMVNPRTQRRAPAAMEMSFVGRGEFLVEDGRWRKLAGLFSTHATGVVKMDQEQQFTMTPLDPIPAKVLEAK